VPNQQIPARARESLPQWPTGEPYSVIASKELRLCLLWLAAVLSLHDKHHTLSFTLSPSLSYKGISVHIPLGCTQEDGSFLEQSGEKLVNKVWIRQKIQATGAKYGITARWLKACLKHEKCRSGSSQFKTPTRLIDVGLSVQYCINRMPRLVVGVDGTVPYVALSYRWGGPQPLILTLETLPHFQQGMPWSDLPKLFQDSITVHRECQSQG
jgi:hypothetical protein